MSARNPNQSDIFQELEAFGFLSGKVANSQADVFQRGETLPSLAPTASTPVTISVPSGQLSVLADAPSVADSDTVPSGLITVSADTAVAGWLTAIPSGSVAFSADAPTLSFAAALQSGAISLSADAPSVSDADAIPSATIAVAADAPTFTQFPASATNVSGGNRLLRPSRKPQPGPPVHAAAVAAVVRITPIPARTGILLPVRAAVAANLITATQAKVRATVTASRATVTRQDMPALDDELRDLIEQTLILIEA